MTEDHPAARVAIIGAGLVGSLNAIYFAERGWQVDVYEKRPDMRLPENKNGRRGRSINLTLSARGLSGLRAAGVGLDAKVLEASLPMHGRMVHINGTQQSQSYSVHRNCINAVNRAHLNEILLDTAESAESANIKVHFEHSLSGVRFDDDGVKLSFEKGQECCVDLLVGADGAYSQTRSQLIRQPKARFDYDQQYIDTLYCELSIPPHKDGFALDPGHLHIWPRRTFMLVAFPNLDKSFTCTLFMPPTMFDATNTEEKLFALFNEHFKDALLLMGEENLKQQYFGNPWGSLVSIKMSPHQYGGKAVLMGDASHAMVPFYGQGINCGFQDVETFHRILDEHTVEPWVDGNGKIPRLAEALTAYSNERVKDAQAICDLSMYNHEEMRVGVTSKRYLLRKKIEDCIHFFFPKLVIPLYSMVSFSTLPYSQTLIRRSRQTRWLNVIAYIIALSAVGVGLRQYKALQAIFSTIYRQWKK